MSAVNELTIGGTYRLRHSRFGSATVQVVSFDGAEWTEVLIVKGSLIGMLDAWIVGDTKTVRNSQCTFTRVEEVPNV